MTANAVDLASADCHIDAIDYPKELERALGALWDGTIGRRLAARPGDSRKRTH